MVMRMTHRLGSQAYFQPAEESRPSGRPSAESGRMPDFRSHASPPRKSELPIGTRSCELSNNGSLGQFGGGDSDAEAAGEALGIGADAAGAGVDVPSGADATVSAGRSACLIRWLIFTTSSVLICAHAVNCSSKRPLITLKTSSCG